MINKSIRNAIKLAVPLCFAALLLSGCWDRIEINDVAFVHAIAIDREDNGSLRLTYLIPLSDKPGGDKASGGGAESFMLETQTANTIREADKIVQKRLSRNLNYTHRRIIVLGEDLAREGIRKTFDYYSRFWENRMTGYVVVAKGKASDLLMAKPKLEVFSSEAIREICLRNGASIINQKNVAQALSSRDMDPVLAYFGIKKVSIGKESMNQIELLGYAQFKNEKMVGVYDNNGMSAITWLKGQVVPYDMTLPMENGTSVGYRVKLGTTNIKAKLEPDGKAHFRVSLNATLNLVESTADLNYTKAPDQEKVQRLASAAIQKQVQDTIKQMQERGTDSVGFGNHFRREYPKQWIQSFEANWGETIKKAVVDVQVKTVISQTGMISENIAKVEAE